MVSKEKKKEYNDRYRAKVQATKDRYLKSHERVLNKKVVVPEAPMLSANQIKLGHEVLTWKRKVAKVISTREGKWNAILYGTLQEFTFDPDAILYNFYRTIDGRCIFTQTPESKEFFATTAVHFAAFSGSTVLDLKKIRRIRKDIEKLRKKENKVWAVLDHV